MFAGWDYRSCWIKNDGKECTTFIFETDKKGNNSWCPFKEVTVPAEESTFITFSSSEKGEWIRVKTDQPTTASVSFAYTSKEHRTTEYNELFKGLASVKANSSLGGLMYGLGNNQRTLGLVSRKYKNGEATANGYYELNDSLQLIHKEDSQTENFILEIIDREFINKE